MNCHLVAYLNTSVVASYDRKTKAEAPLFVSLSKAADQCMCDFSTPNMISNVAWGFSLAGLSDSLLFVALAAAGARQLGYFTPQNLANSAWAFAKAGRSDATLFLALAGVGEVHMGFSCLLYHC